MPNVLVNDAKKKKGTPSSSSYLCALQDKIASPRDFQFTLIYNNGHVSEYFAEDDVYARKHGAATSVHGTDASGGLIQQCQGVLSVVRRILLGILTYNERQ